MDHGALWAGGRRRRIGDGRTHGIQAAYGIVSSLFSKSDFTNRMYLGVSRRTGRSQRHPCRATPEIAIRGDFTLRAQHSVSEIADFSQRLETIGYAVPCAGLFSASVPSLSFGAALKPGSCRLTRLSLEAVLPAPPAIPKP